MAQTRSDIAPPRELQFQGSEARLTYFEWGARDSLEDPRPPVVLVHATGFHARCWDQVVRALPPGQLVYAVDMRGHGRSEKIGPYVWDSFGQDLAELLAHLEVRGAIAVGHSMGGHCVTQVAAGRPEMFSRLLLVDPVILPPEAYATQRYADFTGPEDHPVAKRRGRWRDWREMFERFQDRKPFSLWHPAVLEDYCRFGVVPAADGDGFELACPGLVEASIYLGNTKTNVHGLLADVRVPVLVLRARQRDPAHRDVMDFSASPTWPALADQFPDGTDIYLPHLTHFIPMQEPELIARLIADDEHIVALPASAG